jgi:hypothetical protein
MMSTEDTEAPLLWRLCAGLGASSVGPVHRRLAPLAVTVALPMSTSIMGFASAQARVTCRADDANGNIATQALFIKHGAAAQGKGRHEADFAR